MAIERIINLRVDTGDSDPNIEKTTSTLDKLNKKVVELEGNVEGVKDTASEPIQLDVKTDKTKIDALVASMGDVEKQKEILGDTEVKLKVTDNIPEEQKKVDELGKSLADIDFNKKVELAIDASKAASSIQEVKASQRELQSLLLQTGEGSENFNKLSQAAGESKDRIDDINTAIKAFSKSPLENLAGGFKNVKQSLLDLNFVEFNKQVGLLGQNAKKVSFKELTSSIGETGKSFFSLGKIIASNPLGLIATIITLVIANFDTLKGAIEKIFPPFLILEKLVGGIIGIFKDLGDALGLTSFAADEASSKALDSAEENFDKIQKEGERQIALAKARGKDIVDIQIGINQQLIEQNNIQLETLDKTLKRKGKLTDDEIKKQKELIESNRKLGISIEELTIIRQQDIDKFIEAGRVTEKSVDEQRKSAFSDQQAAILQQRDVLIESSRKAAEKEIKDTKATAEQATAIRKRAQDEQQQIRNSASDQILAISKLSIKADEDATKKQIDDAKKVSEARIKAAQEAANTAFLDQAALKLQDQKNKLQFDSIESARLLLQVNTELLKREQDALNKQLAAGKITVEQFNEAKVALQERYAAENAAAQRTIELRKQLGDIEISARLDTALFETSQKDIDDKLESLRKQKVDIDARIVGGETTDDIVRQREEINKQILSLEADRNKQELQQRAASLAQETSALQAARDEQLKIAKETTTSEADKEAALKKVEAIDRQIQKNKDLVDATRELADIIGQSTKSEISAQDQVTISLVKQFQAIKDAGGELSKFQQEFLDKNKSVELDVKVKADLDELTALQTKLNSLEAKKVELLAGPQNEDTQKLLADTQAALDQVHGAIEESQAQFVADQQAKNEEEGSPLANSLGITPEALKAARDTLFDETLKTFQLLGQLSVEADRERLQKEFESRNEQIDTQRDTELAKLQERLDKGQITQEAFNKKKAEIDKKTEEQKLKLEKANFEKEKQLKLKQLRIELAIEIGRIWASYASLGPGVSAIASAIASAAALVRYGIQADAINSQQFEEGGQVGSSQDAGKTSKGTSVGMVQGPPHKDGGVKHVVRSDKNMIAELEGGEWIIPKDVVAQTPIQRLRDLNAGRLKLFEDGGFVDTQIAIANSTASASGSNVIVPTTKGDSPIGFVAPSERMLAISLVDLAAKQDEISRRNRRVTFRS